MTAHTLSILAAFLSMSFGTVNSENGTQHLLRFFSNSSTYIFTGTSSGEEVLIGIAYTPNKGISDCQALKGRDLIEATLKHVPKTAVRTGSKKDLELYLVGCANFLRVNTKDRAFGIDFLRRFLIYPGTKWCGYGNIAKDDDDLGDARSTDMCCREHDKSEDNIPAFGEKHGFRNPLFYTMTHCDSDRKFFNCLLADSSKPSLEVGRLFFDILKTACYANAHPPKCTKWVPLSVPLSRHKTCEKYTLDTSRPKVWQMFQAPSFSEDYSKKRGEKGIRSPLLQGKSPGDSWKLIY